MNDTKLEIYNEETSNWEDFSKYLAIPDKYSLIYDEQLDEAEIELERCPKSTFLPQTKLRITVTSNSDAVYSYGDFEQIKNRCDNQNKYTFTRNDDGTITAQRQFLMVVAIDNATEKPTGSNLYSHKIYAVEITKLLESVIGDTITFTNPLGHNYLTNQSFAKCDYTRYNSTDSPNETSGSFTSTAIPNIYAFNDNGIEFLSAEELKNSETLPEGITFPIQTNPSDSTQGTEVYTADYTVYNSNSEEMRPSDGSYILTLGTYTIKYSYYRRFTYGSQGFTQTLELTYTFSVIENRLPPKKWTITDVCNRIFDTAEPLFISETPRFRLKGVNFANDLWYQKVVSSLTADSTADKLDKILAPEFSLTKMTVREMLQMVGGRIHAEPRITGINTEENFFEVDFDFYGLQNKSNVSQRLCIGQGSSIDINNYCTTLDSSAENLINALDYAQGVIEEPFLNGYKTLRTDNVAVRLSETDGGAEIQTLLPIYGRPQVKVKYNGKIYDITPFIFEIADYNNLSSFEGSYPYAKAYALYYTQGSNSIKGLFFKAPDAISPVFKKYAISNIMSFVTGEEIDFALGDGSLNTESLLDLSFNITYLPISETRVRTNKSIVKKGLPRTIAYNQTANNIETRYYGENLKGVVSRLGNVEKTKTFALPFISDVPEIGYKYDDTYYITNVSVEVLPTYIKCTVALSEHFNRKSEYVGINSEKRMWEISERQAIDRDTVITEYIYISDNTEKEDEETLLQKKAIETLFGQSTIVSYAIAKGYTKTLNPIANSYFALPVVSSSFGNSMTFTFAFLDNYSAGNNLLFNNDNNNAYSNYAPYTDYYGRLYYLYFNLSNGTLYEANYDKNDLPVVSYSIYDTAEQDSIAKTKNRQNLLTYRKDNRETPKITYEIQAVGDGSVLIGSALMRNCGLVNTTPKNLRLVYLSEPINEFEERIPESSIISGFSISIDTTSDTLTIPAYAYDHKAWAIITVKKTTTLNVADEDGKETTQTIYEGGELVIGQNKKANSQQIKFIKLKNIYSKI